jgi:membrane protein implicated in regulation of membrane protease activity
MSRLLAFWGMALVFAGVGTWLLFDGTWGLNTVAWTATSAGALSACARGRGARPRRCSSPRSGWPSSSPEGQR